MKKALLVSLLAKITLCMDYEEYINIYGKHRGYSEKFFMKNIARIKENNMGNSGF